ncbi:sodium-dependent neutral amino acid transporter B(0)AT3-like isoform X2 [Coccinella septempunctata]|uniref:sodium-dependent neutral amino acid transporter B(0)AT3-like isoform X2 n=1 Tax=Coccinella septempunctata TaxID=41139 RepID=UPI001D077110|nr:sodium-dependent neutral amino acid transporter B(0)AT3-like isoform X2 [Coccinella septempunctata]
MYFLLILEKLELVILKLQKSCNTWLVRLKTIICTVSLSAGLGNLYRLPQSTILNGGMPFIVAYLILTVLIGMPLLFLELGIGQMAEEGFIKSWRVVPFFKGVGYVKLLAGYLLVIYYPLLIGISLFYIVWMLKGPLPFPECAVVKITNDGYSAKSIDRQECLKNTFLESAFKNPYWYGIFITLLLVIWTTTIVLSIRRTKTFMISLLVLIFPTLICFIALVVKAFLAEEQLDSIGRLITNIKWDDLYSANIWYYATIQVFFSTNLGFGTFITNASIMYNKVNPLWIAIGYLASNLLLGIGSILLCYTISGNFNIAQKKENDIIEVHLLTLIYDMAVSSSDVNAKAWALVAYSLIFFVGLISMATMMYTLLKVTTAQNKKKLKWWKTCLISCFICFVAGCGVLLKNNFQIVRLLDGYIVGNLIFIAVIVEVFALITFYGIEKIQCDFEFMLGQVLSKFWLVLWWIIPLLLTGIFCWGLATLPFGNDPEWLSGTGWGVVLVAISCIFFIGIHTITQQDGYGFIDKVKISFQPSKNWGPRDPMQRYTWVQWCSKIQQGERDFTLKRRGTKDYTKGIKKEAKKMATQAFNIAPQNPTFVSYQETKNENKKIVSNIHVLPPNNYEISYKINGSSEFNGTSPKTSTIKKENINGNTFKFNKNKNPLANNSAAECDDDYGTFRKAPYVISENSIAHVCHKKYSHTEAATEL